MGRGKDDGSNPKLFDTVSESLTQLYEDLFAHSTNVPVSEIVMLARVIIDNATRPSVDHYLTTLSDQKTGDMSGKKLEALHKMIEDLRQARKLPEGYPPLPPDPDSPGVSSPIPPEE